MEDIAASLEEPPPRGDAHLARLVDALGPGLDDAVSRSRDDGAGLRAVLHVRAFRRLWYGLATSSFGDWLGLLAQTALAAELGAEHGKAVSAYAIGGVLLIRLLPAAVLGPFAGAVADRFDRRYTMIVADVLRVVIFVSIPLVRTLLWLGIATLLAEVLALFWLPSKEASVPNLLRRDQLEAANTLSLITTYGTAPLAAGVFALLASASRALGSATDYFSTNPENLAFYVDAATFGVSAITVWGLREVGGRDRLPAREDRDGRRRPVAALVALVHDTAEGWRFVGSTRMVRGLTLGIVGAFVAVGGIASVGRLFVGDVGGGDAAYGLFFGGVFLGLALGMASGRALLAGFSRRRLFGLTIAGAGVSLAITSVLPNLVLALAGVMTTGFFAGLAWVTGYTLLGGEVEDAVRGRTFAIVQTLVRITLFGVLAFAPFLVGLIGYHRINLGNGSYIRADGATIVLLLGGLIAVFAGFVAYRAMDDRRGIPLHTDLVAAMRRRTPRRTPHSGLLIAIEGGEGAGKSTQVKLLAQWLRGAGWEVVETRQPGGTSLGVGVRSLLLDPEGDVHDRTELLLYLADRAQHVERVILPALERGAVVITDRFVDSTLAYQGAGRPLDRRMVNRLNDWAAAGLVADLTVLLDVRPEQGLTRVSERGTPDRLENEAIAFHQRVRAGFLEQARRESWRYVVVNTTDLTPEQVAERVRAGALRRFGEERLLAPAPQVATKKVRARRTEDAART